MGRHSAYDQNMPDLNEITIEETERKFGKENMSVKEFAVYLSHHGLPKQTYTEKTIKNYIKRICENSGGALSEKDFKKDPNNSKSAYVIKIEWQKLLFSFMKSNYFEGRKNEQKLSTREKLYRQLLKNIDEILDDVDTNLIKKNAAYANAKLEVELTERINKIMQSILRTLYHLDPCIRYTLMNEFLSTLTSIDKNIGLIDCRLESMKLVYNQCEQDIQKHEDCEKWLFTARELDEYMLALLACRVHGKDTDDEGDEYIIREATIMFIREMFGIQILPVTKIGEIIQQADHAIENDLRYNEIKKKADELLNKDEPYEFFIYRTLLSMVRVLYLRPFVSDDEYKMMSRFVETVVADDKYSLLTKLLSAKSFIE